MMDSSVALLFTLPPKARRSDTELFWELVWLGLRSSPGNERSLARSSPSATKFCGMLPLLERFTRWRCPPGLLSPGLLFASLFLLLLGEGFK